MAFARPQRLKDTHIQLLMKKGRRSASPFFRVLALPSRSGETRVGVIVSAKIAKKAVERNRIRRRLQEAARMVLKESGDGTEPQLLLLFGNQRVLEADFAELQNTIKQIFNV